jgi:hypothetical protein
MIATIKLTKRMLTKHQINASIPFKQFCLEDLGIDYTLIQKGEDGRIVKPAILYSHYTCLGGMFDKDTDCVMHKTELRMYRQTTRGDDLLSIKNLKKIATEGDVLKISLKAQGSGSCWSRITIDHYRHNHRVVQHLKVAA